MATVKELEGVVGALKSQVEALSQGVPSLAQYVELKQLVVGVSMTVDKKFAEFNAEMLAVKQKIGMYYVNAQTEKHRPQPEQHSQSFQPTPWWLPLEAFKNWVVTVPQTRENLRVASLLAKHLKKSSGHGEGQLYMDWKEKVGAEQCAQFWKARGFDGVPDGL